MPSISESRQSNQIPYYDKDVDFDVLANRDVDWAAICRRSKETKWIDFQDPRVLLQLTRSLLKCDFGINSLELPNDRLCPPVPVRWNYVRWIQDLLDTTSQNYSDRYDPDREVTGLDIGVGASAIYPLLACTTRPRWRMYGTDIDQHSLDFARQNVNANGFHDRIKLNLSTEDSPIIPLVQLGVDCLDFVMTNPPFYSSAADMQSSYGDKVAPPSAICTGSTNEMICEGGDVGFVSRILDESLMLRTRVQWYTAMLGKLASLQQIVIKLKAEGITNFAVTCLQAGHRTNRWAVAWSLRGLRPTNDVARHGSLVAAVLPQSTAQTLSVPLMSAEWAGRRVDATIRDLDVSWSWSSELNTGVMEASENVWSRAARRRRKLDHTSSAAADGAATMTAEDGSKELALAVRIECGEARVEIRWLQGLDHVVFESFCGMLKRALSSSP